MAALQRRSRPRWPRSSGRSRNFEGSWRTGPRSRRAARRRRYSIALGRPGRAGGAELPAEDGADIVVGEGQPLGVPMGYGGPLVGFFSIRKKDVRRLPGRLVGVTADSRAGAATCSPSRPASSTSAASGRPRNLHEQGLMPWRTRSTCLLGSQGPAAAAPVYGEGALSGSRRRSSGVTLRTARAYFRDSASLPGPAADS